MAASPYIVGLRARVGDRLLLLPSVAAVIHNSDGRLLLQRKAGAEGWSLPAGGVEPGETPQDALRREVLEETGLSVVSAKLLEIFGGQDFRHTYPNGDQVEYVVALFHCEVQQLNARPTDTETVELRHFAKSDMPRLALPYPPHLLF